MAEWRKRTFGDLGTIYDGPHATPERRSSGPYFLNIASLNDGHLDLSKSDHVSSDDFQKWTRRVTPRPGDLLFSYETRLGEAALMPDGVEACLGRRMALLRPDTTAVDPRFLLYCFLSPAVQKTIEQNTIHGATVNRIPLNRMASWPIEIPDLAEQRAIAEVLGALDDKIAANTRMATIVDQYLSHELEARLRSTTLTSTVKLGEVAEINAGVRRPGPGKIRYIDISSIGDGDVRYPDQIAWEDAPSRARRMVRVGDTLWSTVRPNRRSHALLLDDAVDLVGSTGLAVLTPRDIGFAYLYQVTHRMEFSAHLEAIAEGSAYPTVRADRFGEVLIPLLDPSGTRNFEDLAAPLRQHLHAADVENRALTATRNALLPALMSGALRVKDAERLAEDLT